MSTTKFELKKYSAQQKILYIYRKHLFILCITFCFTKNIKIYLFKSDALNKTNINVTNCKKNSKNLLWGLQIKKNKQTNTYIKYSSNTAQHVRSFYTEQTNAVRIPVNFDLCSSAWSKEHYKMNTNIFHTHQNHTHPIKTRGTATKREREWERPTNTSTQKMRWVIIYTAKCLHSLVYNIYVHK